MKPTAALLLGACTSPDATPTEGAELALRFEDVPSWGIAGDQSYAQLGASVASAGDVNGDGFADVIVGAPCHDVVGSSEGVARLYLGWGAGLATQASLARALPGNGSVIPGHCGTGVEPA